MSLLVDHGPHHRHISGVDAGVARHTDVKGGRHLGAIVLVEGEVDDVHLELRSGRPAVLRDGR